MWRKNNLMRADKVNAFADFMKHTIAGLLSVVALGAQAQTGPVKIGEINSYSSMPQFTCAGVDERQDGAVALC
jgi:hypothetical protein